MKPSKPVLDRSRGYDLKVVIPRMKETMSKSQPKPLFKRKKQRHERSSGCSDKENDNSGSVVYSQPNLNLIQIEKVLNLDQRDGLIELSPADHKLVRNIFNKRETRTTEYSKVSSCGIENSDISNETVRHSESTGARSNTNNVDVDISTPKHQKKKAKKDKCYRKDSGIGMESPKAKRTKKRKFSDHLDYQPDDVQETASIHSSESEIRGLEDIIQSHSSHTCSDKVDHKINNVETIRTSMGLYVHRDFEIRMTQVCTDQPSKDSIPACTTSVVASTTRCENIEKSARKERRNVAVEKKIGINTRVKVGDREKNCTRIVESKLVETTEQRHKRIKLDEPSGMVTRRKAAVNLEYKFYTLTNQKNCGLVENSNISNKQNNQQNQNQENGAKQKKKSKPSSKKILPKERKPETTNKKNKANEPKSLGSKSFHSSNEGEKTNAEKFENIATNFKQKIGSRKILKDVTLCRLENTESWPRRIIQKIEQSVEKKTSRAPKERPKKISNLDQNSNKRGQEADVIAGTKQLRNYTKTKKRLDDKENAIDNETNAKQSDSSSSAKVLSKVSLPKGKKQDFKSSTKLKNHKSIQQMKDDAVEFPNNTSVAGVISPLPGCSGISLPKGKKYNLKSSAKLRDCEPTQKMNDDEVELPKKHPKLPEKKLMKKNEALEKTERFNEKKKVLINGDMTVSSKTVSILLEDIAPLEDIPLSRRIDRFSSKTQDTSSVANTSKVKTARGPPAVTFSSKTPKTIPRRENYNGNDWDQNYTPCILLDKLDSRDISTYAITPLREDRRPLASKSTEDYGIDDVNTDDSTDEEECPKKMVPNWVKSAGHNSKVQFYFPREVILTWIRPPKKKFTVQNLFT